MIETTIDSVVKIAPSEYIINGTIQVKINEDSSLTVSFDEKVLCETQVFDLIDEFLELK